MSVVFTVVGARGFIGGTLAAALRAKGCEVRARRSEESAAGDSGHVVYVSGVAWGAERRPADAYEVHVEGVRRALATGRAESFTFVSSTRVYDGAVSTSEESSLAVRPRLAADAYAISKIAGENLVLAHDDPRLRVVRLSNVFGPSFRSELFVSQIVRDALRDGAIRLRSDRASAKDYVDVAEVAELIPQIAQRGRERIYNIARGVNTTHGAILDAIASATGARVEISAGAPAVIVAPVSIARLGAEFAVPSRRVEDAIPDLVRAFREHLGAPSAAR